MSKVYKSLVDVDITGENFTKPLPLGPEGVVTGELDNGVRYYVRKCQKPKERVAIALAVKIGSVVEEDQEQGVAHIVEHLAFNATEGYSNHEIVKFLEGIGAQFGACQNAYTSADETVYQLVVPSSQGELLDQSIAVMAQFAFKIRCAAGDLDKERGAVLEEWRMSRDAAGRAQEAHWQLILAGSKYADRLPIGKEDIVRNVTAATVKSFYQRWYRPENMALVVVGDFPSLDDVVAAITRHMCGDVAPHSSAQLCPVPSFTYVPHEVPRYRVFVDKEVQDVSLFVSFKHARKAIKTPQDFKEHLTELLFQSALGARLFKLSRLTDPPFLVASATSEPLTASIESYVLSAVTLQGGALRALDSVLSEVARVRLHGFTEREFAMAKSELVAEIESTYLERDQGYCWDYRDEYVRHFLNQEFVTGQEYEARLSKTLMPTITRSDVNGVADRYHPRHSCVVKVVEHVRRCSEDDLAGVVKSVWAAEEAGTIGAWQDGDVPESLMAVPPAPGSVVSRRTFADLDATELTLSNGLKVCYKLTSFMEDEVLVTGFAAGGLSEVPREHFWSASLSNVIAGQLGAYGLRPDVLNDVIAGKRVELNYSEGAYARSFTGNNSPHDLETAFQLVHLLFTTNVRVDHKELAVVMKMVEQGIAANLRNPLYHYHQRVRLINYGGCYYFEPITLEDLKKVDAELACAFHNNNYRNPAEFTVVLTGNLSEEAVLPLVQTYLASIPSCPLPPPLAATNITPLPFSFPEKPVIEDVEVSMVSPITQTQITFPVELERSQAREELVWLTLACRLLETKLLQKLRFQFGEIYTVVVSPFFGCEAPSNPGNPRGDVSVSFTCDPRAKDRLIELALQTLTELQAEGPSASDVETLKTIEQLQFENNQQENSYWHEMMVSGYQSKTYQQLQDLAAVYARNLAARQAVLSDITPQQLRQALVRLFPHPCNSRYTAITMVPQPPSLMYHVAAALTDPRTLRVLALTAAVAVTATGALWLWRRRTSASTVSR